jgi:VIT1/CCC1 family predicted Fe2+/Mn2+ transporter
MAAREAPTAAEGVSAIRNALSKSAQRLLSDTEIESMRQRLASATDLPDRPRLAFGDVLGAIRIFFIVVLSTFPVVLPFVLWSDVPTALVVSRILTLIMLFIGGMALGHHAGFNGWATALGMMALGVALTMAVIALGG